MKVSFIKWDQIQTIILPEKISGHFGIFDSENEIEILSVDAVNEKWQILAKDNIEIISKGQLVKDKVVLNVRDFYTIRIKKTDEQALIYTEPITQDRQVFNKFSLPLEGIISIGKLENNDIVFESPFVSRKHGELIITLDKILIRDLESANGIYVNNKNMKEAELFPGDNISIMGLNIILGNRFLALNNPDGCLKINNGKLKPLKKEIISAKNLNLKEKIAVFYKVPRFKKEIQEKTYQIDPPPARQITEKVPLLLMLGPSITMGMTSVTMGMVAVQSVISTGSSFMTAIPSLIMSFSMLLGTILWPTLTKKYEKKRENENEKERQHKYKKYLSAVSQNFEEEGENQAQILRENYLSPYEQAKKIFKVSQNLWERTVEQNDFLDIRLGQGSKVMNGNFEYPRKQFSVEDDFLKNLMYQIMEKPKLLENVPISLNLKNEKVCGFIGNYEDRMCYFKNFLVQVIALHSYDELKLVFLYKNSDEEILKDLKWIPHTWNQQKTVRYIGRNISELKEIANDIEKEINYRETLRDEELEESVPKYIIFLMDKELENKAEFIQRILMAKKHLGFTILSFYNEFNKLPKECTKVIEIRTGIGKIYDREDTSGVFQTFKPDFDEIDLSQIGKKISNIELGILSEKKNFPSTVNFLEMYKAGKIEHLNLLNRWALNDPVRSLEVPVGVNIRGEHFKIDFHEKYHGPHGLIAGMTGSGKSEFIMTFILSMAVNFHPYEVAFILIDYKGGGMANAFEKLPHLAGTITNLDGREVKRSLISIQSELNRRQNMFRKIGEKLEMTNIDIYDYQRLYREGQADEPLQHLFIISDEFAELKTQEPEFMDQLISAARIGRSLGIHLILATQKPSGVVDDQIWSNSRLKICLKVQEKADSMDMIKRPDAAGLKDTGRFYMQVGYNEYFDCGQSAWGGASYYPEETMIEEIDDSIVFVNRVGQIIKEAKESKKNSGNEKSKKQLDTIVEYIEKQAKMEQISVKPLWLPPLRQKIIYKELIKKYSVKKSDGYILSPVIGEYDDPTNQRQCVFRLELNSNMIIYGAPGTGKAEFIQAMIYSLILNYGAEDFQTYLLDFGSEALSAFKDAPQVGDVVFSYEKEKIENLFNMLSKEIVLRKKRFSDEGGDFETHFKKNKNQRCSQILVVIDNYVGFSENYEDAEDQLGQLAREGVKYGIYFAVTTVSPGSIRYRIAQNFKQNFVLQLNDENDYSAILGNVQGVFPSHYKGRGIFKEDNIYEFQIAEIVEQDESKYDSIAKTCEGLKEQSKDGVAKKIPLLPKIVDVSFLKNDEISLRKVPIGLRKDNFNKVMINIESSVTYFILAKNLSGIYIEESIECLLKKKYFVKTINSVSKEECEKEINRLFNKMVHRNNTYKEALEKNATLPNFDKEVYILKGLKEIFKITSVEMCGNLKLLLEKGEKEYHIHFLIIEEERNVDYSLDTWYQKHFSGQDGLWIGEGIAEQYTLKPQKTVIEMYDQIDSSFGYLIEDGKVISLKRIKNKREIEEE